MADPIGAAYLRILPDMSGLNARLGAYFSSSEFSKMGKAAGVALGAGLAAGGVVKGLYEIGQAYDTAYDKIRVNTGATGKRLKRLESDFKDVIGDVPANFDDASEAIAGLNQRLGLTGRPLQKVSKQLLELSRITKTDVGDNVQSVTRLFGDWSIKTGKQADTLDKLFRAAQETGIKVSDLSDLMVQFGSPLRQLGLDFDTSAAMFARFEKEGVNIQTLMPGLRMALKNFSAPTADLTAQMDKLGISLKDGPAAALQEVFAALENAPSDLKANALAFQIFGARAGPDMAAAVREGRFELDDLMKTIENGKDTIRTAGRDTMDFAEQWTLLKNNAMNALEPLALKVFKEAGDEMARIRKILTDKSLSGDEKLSAVLDELGRVAERVIPDVVKAGINIGTKLAGAILKGIVNLDPKTQLSLLAIVGGVTAIKAAGLEIGTLLGKSSGKGFAIGLALALPALGIELGTWIREHKTQIVNSGSDAGEWFVNAIIDVINAGLAKVFDPKGGFLTALNTVPGLGPAVEALGAAFDAPTIDHVDFGHIRDEVKKTEVPFRDLIDTVGKSEKALKDHAKGGGEALEDLAGKTKKTGSIWDSYGHLVKKVTKRGTDDAKDHGAKTQTALGNIVGSLDKTDDKAKKHGDVFADVWGGMSKRSGKLAKNVTANNANMTNAVGDGLGVLRGNVLAATKEFGVKSKITYSIKKADKAVSTVTNLLNAQKGAIVPGTGSGDTVPLHVGGQLAAMVEPGELVSVANRKATAAMMRVNEKIPRFQGGGLVPHLAKGGMTAMLALANKYERKSYPYRWGGGHGDFANAMSPVDCSGAVSDILHAGGLLSGAPMVSGALMGWGKPAKGGEPLVVYANPHHTVMSLNGKTFGTSGSNPGGGAGWIEGGNGASLAPGAKRTMGVMAELARVILQGPAGRQKKLGQAGLDRVWKAGKSYLAKQSPMGAAGGGDWGPVGDAIVKGRATWFTGGGMASGKNTDVDPGIALNPNPGGPDPGSWNNPTTQRWLADAQQFLVSIGGKQTALPVLDMGPAGWTGNAIDVDRAGVSKLGFSTSSFPSGTVGTARIIKRRLGGLVPHLARGGLGWPWDNMNPVWTKDHRADLKARRAGNLLEHLNRLMGDKGRVPALEESISIAETRAGLASSPARSEMSAGELAKQIGLNEELLSRLAMARKLSKEGLNLTSNRAKNDPRFRKLKNQFAAQLLDLVGLTGRGGRIFETQMTLADLKGTTLGGETLDIGGLRSVIEAARYGVFDNQLPRFHEGGTYRAPIGRNEGPAILKDGETVSPAGGIEVTNNWSWDGFDLVVETEINGALAKRERKRYQRARQRA